MMSLTTLFCPGRLAGRLHAVVIAAVLAAPLPAAAMDYINVTLQPDSATPTACFTFSSAPRHGQRQVTEAFVALAPALDHSVDLRGTDLCVGGFRYGETNTVTLKAGLPGVDGTSLPKSVTVVVRVPDREPAVSLNSAKTVLPFTKGVGLPVKSVNVAKAHVVLYHVNDRAMVDHLADDWFGHDLDGISQVEDNATKVYEGSLDIASVRNKQVATTMPLDALVKGLQPGIYVAVASPTVAGKEAGPSATQWFSVSDLGLTAIKTQAGMLVVARSLQSALPQPDVTVKLFSRANEVLGTYRTGPRVASPSLPACCAASMARRRRSSRPIPRAAASCGCRSTRRRSISPIWTSRGVRRQRATMPFSGPTAASTGPARPSISVRSCASATPSPSPACR